MIISRSFPVTSDTQYSNYLVPAPGGFKSFYWVRITNLSILPINVNGLNDVFDAGVVVTPNERDVWSYTNARGGLRLTSEASTYTDAQYPASMQFMIEWSDAPDATTDFSGAYPVYTTQPQALPVPGAGALPVSVTIPQPLEVTVTELPLDVTVTGPVDDNGNVNVTVTNITPDEYRYCVHGQTADGILVAAPGAGKSLKIVRAEIVPEASNGTPYIKTSSDSLYVGMASMGAPHNSEWQAPQGLGNVGLSWVMNGCDQASFAAHVQVTSPPPPPPSDLLLGTSGGSLNAYDTTSHLLQWSACNNITLNDYGTGYAVNPAGTQVVVAKDDPQQAFVVELLTGTVLATINGTGPHITYGTTWQDNNNVLVLWEDSPSSSPRNLHCTSYAVATGTVNWSYGLGSTGYFNPSPASASGGNVWVTHQDGSIVYVLRGTDGALLQSYDYSATGWRANSTIVFAEGNAIVLTVDQGSRTTKIWVYNASSLALIATTVTASLCELLTAPHAGGVWMTNGTVPQQVDPTNGAVTAPVTTYAAPVYNYVGNKTFGWQHQGDVQLLDMVTLTSTDLGAWSAAVSPALLVTRP